MENKIKKIILIVATIVVATISGLTFYNNNKETDVLNIINNVVDEVLISEELQELKEATESTKIIEQSIVDEQALEIQEIESEGFELQGQIAYESGQGIPSISVGEKIGLTYYSQVDSRWSSQMYSSTNNKSQTIGSSGCGPTSAAMVVTSIKGIITPNTMSDLYVQYGYRSANDGTYWSAFRWTADVFDIPYQETSSLDTAINLLKNNNYVIASVGNGLFTTGGHFIVLVGIDGDTIKIYDPYLYSGKFDTSTRRGKVSLQGNIVYCSIDNFRNYANYKGFFAYKYDPSQIPDVPKPSTTVESYTRKVNTTSGVNVRSGPGTNYSRVNGLTNATVVIVYEVQGNWSRTNYGWICSDYLTDVNNAKYPGYLIKQGSTGANVKLIQQRVGASVDGVFGPITRNAVKVFQKANGLSQDGVVGPKTWQKLFG